MCVKRCKIRLGYQRLSKNKTKCYEVRRVRSISILSYVFLNIIHALAKSTTIIWTRMCLCAQTSHYCLISMRRFFSILLWTAVVRIKPLFSLLFCPMPRLILHYALWCSLIIIVTLAFKVFPYIRSTARLINSLFVRLSHRHTSRNLIL